MSDHFSEDDLKHLSDLEALRDRGVLSIDEFERARRRLAASRTIGRPVASEPQTRRPLYANWVFLLAVGVGVVLLGIWFFSMRAREIPTVTELDNGSLLNESAALPGPELCSSEAAYQQLKEIVFDRAIGQFHGDAGPLNSLRRAVSVRMQYPMLRDVYAQIQRTDCSGRLILDIPPAAQDEFNGATALQADVQYAIQATPEGTNNVVEFGGSEILVQRIVAAATLLADAQAAAGDAVKQGGSGWPAPNCDGQLSDRDRLICENSDFLKQDRALAERYDRLSRTLSAGDRMRLAERRRSFLGEREKCPDVGCLARLYDEEAEALNRLTTTSIDVMEL